MKRTPNLRLRLLLGIAAVVQVGCGHDGPGEVSTTPDLGQLEAPEEGDDRGDGERPVAGEQTVDLHAQGEEALARLAALEVVDAMSIVDPNPNEGPNCYSMPCTDEEMASQLERLEVLVDVVADAVSEGPLPLSDAASEAADGGDCSVLNADIEASLAALRSLHIVSVQGLSGGDASHCYCFAGGDPCVDAVAEKAGVLARAVAEAEGTVPPAIAAPTE